MLSLLFNGKTKIIQSFFNIFVYNKEFVTNDLDKYGFVLRPMVEVAPELQHPVSGKTMSQLWDGFDAEIHPMQKVDIGLN